MHSQPFNHSVRVTSADIEHTANADEVIEASFANSELVCKRIDRAERPGAHLEVSEDPLQGHTVIHG
jgi:hypothetical protein